AGDYGYWRQGMDPDVLNEFPAQRFIRVLPVKEPRTSHMSYVGHYVFTPYGAFAQEGDTAKIALARFRRMHQQWEVSGVVREDLVIKPPTHDGGPPFFCMFIQGKILSQP